MARRTEDEQRAWLRKVMPMLAILMPIGAYVIVRVVGEDARTGYIIAGGMLFLVLSTWVMRLLFGPKGFIIAMAALALLGWRLQQSGIL